MRADDARDGRAAADGTSASLRIRHAQAEDADRMLDVWERSVRATHHFLSDGDVQALLPFVAEALATEAVDWWVLESSSRTVVGFLGLTTGTIEALFIDPDHHGRGGGRLLVAHAQRLHPGPLAVDVNEQNEAAVRFYESVGFSVVGRSPTDSAGRPFPLLHMLRPEAAAPRDQTAER